MITVLPIHSNPFGSHSIPVDHEIAPGSMYAYQLLASASSNSGILLTEAVLHACQKKSKLSFDASTPNNPGLNPTKPRLTPIPIIYMDFLEFR
ncbi:hypothetical protein LENED_012603 [Lentinula edodes]|uniref:Uncharacterized protein n=1 Tax=Lentinula edodes TaxID=5353 RepID=A0A1Q3ET31_LENED|nr:hypothetical protein LENED_012603 [Lentinula edodes]